MYRFTLQKIFFLVLSAVILLVSTLFYFLKNEPVDPQFFPQNLSISQDISKLKIVNAQGTPLDIGMVVSLTRIDKNHLIFCNYATLYLLNLDTGLTKILLPPASIQKWVPTAVKYYPSNKTLYIANYLGKDCFAFKLDSHYNLQLEKRYVDVDMVGPEGICATKDGKIVAVVDFDSSKLIVFKEGQKAWSYPAKRAHGVTFSTDEKFIYVSSLDPAQVLKFSLTGDLISQVDRSGFGKNSYLYPTAVSTCSGKVAVTDAHTGKISMLDEDLNFLGCVGGNGPGHDLFNMPYGLEFTEDGLMYVADTFKSRILEINPFTGAVFAIYEGMPSNKALNFSGMPSQKQEPIGKGYVKRANPECLFSMDLPYFDSSKEKFCHASHGIYTVERGKPYRIFSLTGSSPLMSAGSYYWTFGAHYTYHNKNFTIIGSPQTHEWFVIYKGIVAPVRLGLDFWLDVGENAFVSTAYSGKLPFSDVIQQALPKIEAYMDAIQEKQAPLMAMAKHLFGEGNFEERFKAAFLTEPGKKFYAALQLAKTTEEIRKTALEYLSEVKKERNVSLVEILIAETILYTPDEKG